MRIWLCDDEEVERSYLAALVEEWAKAQGVPLQLCVFSGAEALLFAQNGGPQADLLLLDIQMGPLDGVTLAKRIRQTDTRVEIVFITGFPDYMAEGYDVAALHYLMKPVGQDKLFPVLDRARQRLQAAGCRVLIPHPGGSLRLWVEDIFYAEAFSHSMTLYLNQNEPISLQIRLKDLQALLGPSFFRCHRSYLVNMAHVYQVTRAGLVLDTGETIPIARGLYAEANDRLIRFCYREEGENRND